MPPLHGASSTPATPSGVSSETAAAPPEPTISSRKRLLALILCVVFGVFGAHRFYVGKTATAILQLVTLGGLVIWFLIDALIILFGEFTDRDGRRISDWL